jgi:hypothetical protein
MIFHWVLVLLLSSGLPVELVAPQTPVQFAAEEDFPSERHDETSKPSASRKRSDRSPKTHRLHRPTLVTTAYPPMTGSSDWDPLPLTRLSHQQLRQLHQVFRI